jgi:hypothetical protein
MNKRRGALGARYMCVCVHMCGYVSLVLHIHRPLCTEFPYWQSRVWSFRLSLRFCPACSFCWSIIFSVNVAEKMALVQDFCFPRDIYLCFLLMQPIVVLWTLIKTEDTLSWFPQTRRESPVMGSRSISTLFLEFSLIHLDLIIILISSSHNYYGYHCNSLHAEFGEWAVLITDIWYSASS